LFKINQCGAYFVTRAKENLDFVRVSSRKVKKKKGVLCDQTINLKGFHSSEKYPVPLRRIRFIDKGTEKRFVFITNNFTLAPEDIALLYKYRWKIELFFKWIKQHLKVKSFWGTSPNAVKVQIYTAIITYCLIVIVKSKLKSTRSNYEILQILSVALLDKIPLKELLSNPNYQDVKEQNYIQLNFDLF
jgi:hypothetical protein